MRLIDADELLKDKVSNAYVSRFEIESMPTIDAKPVVHARWLTDEDDDVYCSHCQCNALFNNMQVNNEPYDYVESPRCPNCGAKMDEKYEMEAEQE